MLYVAMTNKIVAIDLTKTAVPDVSKTKILSLIEFSHTKYWMNKYIQYSLNTRVTYIQFKHTYLIDHSS